MSQRHSMINCIEKNNIVGGMCRTWKWGEYLVDTGPHIFHTPDKKLSDSSSDNVQNLIGTDIRIYFFLNSTT